MKKSLLSSRRKERRGPISKTGDSFCPHLLMQAAWCYRFKPAVTETLRKRTRDVPEWVSYLDIDFRSVDVPVCLPHIP